MTVLVGVIGAAFLFGLFAMLRPRQDASCGGDGKCAGCTGEGSCESDGVKR
jgi:hypothetical protein